ncbi:unnamed protein product [marine sediment metagenome]|uniref:Uncharacterized protein n=1 Tax=marine sediment metagenome TaxID=412755 RepID=X0S4C1_9ZZZZ
MDIKVDIKPEQINQAVSEAIINSVIGERLKEAIESELKRMSDRYDSPIRDVVRNMILGTLRDIISRDYKALIEAKVKESITDEMMSTIIDKAWKSFETKF